LIRFLKQIIEDALNTKKEKFLNSQITAGKIGNTTTIIYSDSNDGNVQRSGIVESFATITSGNGTSVDDTTALQACPELNGKIAVPDNYDSNYRCRTLFDTTSIPDTDTISSATYSFVASGKTADLGTTPVYLIPFSNGKTSLGITDYQNAYTRTELGNIAWASITADNSTYNDISLNATGINWVNATSSTDFGLIFGWDFNQSFTGTWASNVETRILFRYSEEGGTTKDPKLTIEHSASSGGGTGSTSSATTTDLMILNQVGLHIMLIFFASYACGIYLWLDLMS